MNESVLETVELYKPSIFTKAKQKFEQWNYQRKLKKLDKLLDSLVDNSNLASHALNEFKAVGYDPEQSEEDPNKWIQENVIQLLKVFATQGHSGSSAPFAIRYFERLASFKPLGPLTGEDWEWMDVSDYGPSNERKIYQNKRKSSVFKDDNGAYNIDGRVFWEWYEDPETGEKFKSYYTTQPESRVPVEFPYEVPDKPIYEYRKSEAE